MKDDYLVQCPFYIEDLPQGNYKSIVCEGAADAYQLRLVFDDKNVHIAHKKAFCRDVRKYKLCPVYQLLSQKYK